MDRHNLLYREGYARAIMDLGLLLERCEPGMKGLRANNIQGVRGLLECIQGNVDYFMAHGDTTDFELVEKGKRKTEFRIAE